LGAEANEKSFKEIKMNDSMNLNLDNKLLNKSGVMAERNNTQKKSIC